MYKNWYKYIFAILLSIVIGSSCNIEDYEYHYAPTLVVEDPILKDDCEYIIVIGDIQVYTNNPNYYKFLGRTMDWIWSQYKLGKNISCVLQTGDITEQNLPHQYQVFADVTSPIANLIPYVSCPGNHDYTRDINGKISSRDSSLFSSYVNFPITKNYIESYYEKGKMENIVLKHYIHNERCDIISLEFGARKQVIDWAYAHVKAHPDRKYIILTHEYLTAKGVRISKNSSAQYYFESTNTTYSTPDYIWKNLIEDNNNIISVICGHNGFSKKLFTRNSNNREVAQILFNIQYQPNGGDGLIQIWEFPPNSNQVNVVTYNTNTRQVYRGEDHNYNFLYK